MKEFCNGPNFKWVILVIVAVIIGLNKQEVIELFKFTVKACT